MPNLGNAWHLPNSPEPRGVGGMRSPTGQVPPGTPITLVSGNQDAGPGGNPGNQLQADSLLHYRVPPNPDWAPLPVEFLRAEAGNKYYAAVIGADATTAAAPSATVQYFWEIAYSDHDTTFVHATADAQSGTAAAREDATAAPFELALADPRLTGSWTAAFPLPNVAVHATVLATGKVLIWGRRDEPGQSLDVHECTPLLWDPGTGIASPTGQPTNAAGQRINLFCSGHALRPDGTVVVAGGHDTDGRGIDAACLYDPGSGAWTALPSMNHGRWYPTVTALPDGQTLVLSGSYAPGDGGVAINPEAQILNASNEWQTIPPLPDGSMFDLYPRIHSAGQGSLIMTGPLVQTWRLQPSTGAWQRVADRSLGRRDYCPSVQYDQGKIIYIGGGNDADTGQPTAAAEVLDIATAAWRPAAPMAFRRRQHNATLLPDGTVLVTGGTRGGGFNNLDRGQPIHEAELWDPVTDSWTTVAAESVDRCYHATAVLLPDATVLSAGGGEYRPQDGVDADNPVQDSHRSAQIYSPAYLLAGPRPLITDAPDAVAFDADFTVKTPQPESVTRATLIGLSSVTHSFNMGQRLIELPLVAQAGQLQLTTPAIDAGHPAGPYLLFLLSDTGTPSIGHVLTLTAPAVPPPPRLLLPLLAHRPDPPTPAAPPTGTRVRLGITGVCPYGIGACWGGANEALHHLDGVAWVAGRPNAEDSTADVALTAGILPPTSRWHSQFAQSVNGSYQLRGIEVTVTGHLAADAASLTMTGPGQRRVALAPFTSGDDIRRRPRPTPPSPTEEHALDDLRRAAQDPLQAWTVTGTLTGSDDQPALHVRAFTPATPHPDPR